MSFKGTPVAGFTAGDAGALVVIPLAASSFSCSLIKNSTGVLSLTILLDLLVLGPFAGVVVPDAFVTVDSVLGPRLDPFGGAIFPVGVVL